MRLLTVSHYFESHRGGIEIVAGRLARSLAEVGVNVTWAASDASPAPADLSAIALRTSNVIERSSGLPFPLPKPSSFARLLAAVRQSDAVLIHDGMYLTNVVAMALARFQGRPVVLVQHIGRVPGRSIAQTVLFAIADRVLTRPMLRRASQVVFISCTSQRHFAKVRFRREPISIYNGVDASVFRPIESEQERTRENLGWPTGRPVMLFVGRFLEKKGLLRLRDMARMRPDLHWAFAGWGPCDPGEWGFDNVTVHRSQSAAEVAQLYRAADLLVLPSKSEGFPLVVQEALACGLHPVCCADAAEADPAARHFVTSIANEGSEAAIVDEYLAAIDSLVVLTREPEMRRSRAAFARTHYAWDVAAKTYQTILCKLISESDRLTHRKRATA